MKQTLGVYDVAMLRRMMRRAARVYRLHESLIFVSVWRSISAGGSELPYTYSCRIPERKSLWRTEFVNPSLTLSLS